MFNVSEFETFLYLTNCNKNLNCKQMQSFKQPIAESVILFEKG